MALDPSLILTLAARERYLTAKQMEACRLETLAAADPVDALIRKGWLTPDQGRKLSMLAVQVSGGKTGLLDDLLVPAKLLLGRYEVQDCIGTGGGGSVYRGMDVQLNRAVAIKRIQHQDRHRFLREAKATARLQHPHIVSIFDMGEEDGAGYLILQLIDGQDLIHWLQQSHPGFPDVARVLQEVSEAIAHAHAHRILHRDLKPQNILIDGAGKAYVTDFGLARELDSTSQHTLPGTLLGTPAYMSPEQTGGDPSEVIEQSDVFALGATLYYALVRKPPFAGKTIQEVVLKIQLEEPERPRSLNPAVPSELEKICMKALEKSPSRRYATASALAKDLARYRAGKPIEARSAGAFERIFRWSRRRTTPLLAGGIGVLGLALLLLWITTRPKPPPQSPTSDSPTVVPPKSHTEPPAERSPPLPSLRRAVRDGDVARVDWRYDFSRPDQLLDWSVAPDEPDPWAGYSLDLREGTLRLDNARAAFVAPLEGEQELSVSFTVSEMGGLSVGLTLGGYSWAVQDAKSFVLRTPSGREIEESRTSARLVETTVASMGISSGKIWVGVGGKELFRTALPEPPISARPALFANRNTGIRCGKIRIRGDLPGSWSGETRKRYEALEAATFDPSKDLLQTPSLTGYETTRQGTWVTEEDRFCGHAEPGERAGLLIRGAARAFRLQFRCAQQSAPRMTLGIRTKDGWSQYRLPLGEPNVEKLVEVVVLGKWVSCTVDQRTEVLPVATQPPEPDGPLIRLEVESGNGYVRRMLLEEIRNPPPD